MNRRWPVYNYTPRDLIIFKFMKIELNTAICFFFFSFLDFY